MSGVEAQVKIVAHRGFWRHADERNSETAFRRAFAAGFGVETDVRDHNGELVISHDVPVGDMLAVADFLAIFREYPAAGTLAINVKADGLQSMLREQLERFGVEDYFVFDMSIPDNLVYREQGFRYYARVSDVEPEPLLYDQAAGVWLDMFHTDWPRGADIVRFVADNRSVCVVSPELHRRPHLGFWSRLREFPSEFQPALALCTDFPDEAERFFA